MDGTNLSLKIPVKMRVNPFPRVFVWKDPCSIPVYPVLPLGKNEEQNLAMFGVFSRPRWVQL